MCCPYRMIGNIFRSHLFFWLYNRFSIQTPAHKCVTCALHSFRFVDAVTVINFLRYYFFCAINFISICKCCLIFFTFVINFNYGFSVSFYNCCLFGNSLYRKIFKYNTILFYFVFLRRQCKSIRNSNYNFRNRSGFLSFPDYGPL